MGFQPQAYWCSEWIESCCVYFTSLNLQISESSMCIENVGWFAGGCVMNILIFNLGVLKYFLERWWCGAVKGVVWCSEFKILLIIVYYRMPNQIVLTRNRGQTILQCWWPCSLTHACPSRSQNVGCISRLELRYFAFWKWKWYAKAYSEKKSFHPQPIDLFSSTHAIFKRHILKMSGVLIKRFDTNSSSYPKTSPAKWNVIWKAITDTVKFVLADSSSTQNKIITVVEQNFSQIWIHITQTPLNGPLVSNLS